MITKIFCLLVVGGTMSTMAQDASCRFTPTGGQPSELVVTGWMGTLDGAPVELAVGDHSCGPHHFRTGWTFHRIDRSKRHTAVLSGAFVAPADGVVEAGLTGDWFYDVEIDGKTVFTTGSGGNATCEYGYWNNTMRAAVAKGPHTLKVTLRNGLGVMMFALGMPEPKPVRVKRRVSVSEALDAAKRVWAGDVYDRKSPSRLKDLETLQHAVDMTSAADAVKFVHDGADDALFAKAPALAVINAGIDRAIREIPETVVEEGSVAVWYLYDMGFVIKTPGGTTFGIDVSCPRDDEIADLLDFALVTHNHDDHASARLLRAMQKKGGFANGKPVVSAFLYTPYVARRPRTFTFGDCTVKTGISDHNPCWTDSMTPYKVICGKGPNAVTLLHHGDGWDARQIGHFAPVDIAIVHVWPWEGHNGQETARVLKPRLLVLSHAQELTHGFGPGRWSWEQCEEEAELATEAGRVVCPVWGEKFVYHSVVKSEGTKFAGTDPAKRP